jgi:glycosyltransferase involved in cell wall biosynthesis
VERATVIIPCYNEARRLDRPALATLLDDSTVDVLFVDDGSTDDTRRILEDLAREHPARIGVLALANNRGKAEAVRRGLSAVIEAGRSAIVGYLDADLATSPAEMHRLLGIMRASDAQLLFGARVALLGHKIERSAARHYLGRVFATLASLALRLPAYDTQCGAKLFRVTPMLAEAVRDRFLSRWAFDVELLGRLLIGSATAPPISTAMIWEEPLGAWRDVKGSKLGPGQMAKALLDLARIDRDLARRRAARRTPGTSR